MSNAQDEARQISATLNPAAENGTTLRANVERKANAPFGAAKSQHNETALNIIDDEHYVMDFGWNEDKAQISQPLVDGMSNEDLWILVRRFNKQIFHLKMTTQPSPGGLDFNVAGEEEFSPNKLRSYIERLYRETLVGLLAFVQHIVRLRSWREPRRTASFCLVYFTAWYADFLMPTILSVTLVLVISPKARGTMFPPAPPALVDTKTGGVARPPAGVLASTDSATGAPENVKGEAVEKESSNFVAGIAAIAMNTLIEKDPQNGEGQEGDREIDEPFSSNDLATTVAAAQDKASGVDNPSQDKTKTPMEKIMWSKMRPLMHTIGVISDIWERSANLLNPARPFSQEAGRRRVAVLLLPLLIISMFITCRAVYRAATFGLGCVFFGSNDAMRAYNWLKAQKLTITNTLFSGIPTDAQLTITLLRLGEVNRAPLIPPHLPQKAPPRHPKALDNDDLDASGGDCPLGATEEEIRQAVQENPEVINENGGNDQGKTANKKRGMLLGLLKGSAKTAAKTIIAVDKVRAKAGAESAKNRKGATSVPKDPPISGPIEFSCRYRGEKGFAYLTTEAKSPCLCYSRKPLQEDTLDALPKELQPAWVVPIASIVELKKRAGYGAKAKLAAGWALGSTIMDGLEIIDNQGHSTLITAVPFRDELFNRLCAMGSQKWEVW